MALICLSMLLGCVLALAKHNAWKETCNNPCAHVVGFEELCIVRGCVFALAEAPLGMPLGVPLAVPLGAPRVVPLGALLEHLLQYHLGWNRGVKVRFACH